MNDSQFKWDFRGRKSIRVPGYDYSSPGRYGVTICVNKRTCLFGKIINSRMHLNDSGHAMLDWWIEIGQAFKRCIPGISVIMPNHMHGIITIDAPVGAALRGRPDQALRGRPEQVVRARPDLSAGRDQDLLHDPSQHPWNLMDDESLDIHPHREEILRSLSERHLTARGGHTGPPLREPSLPEIMDWFKTRTTNEYIQGVKMRDWPQFQKYFWQRNYWESIINNDRQYDAAVEYIINNPRNWQKDELFYAHK